MERVGLFVACAAVVLGGCVAPAPELVAADAIADSIPEQGSSSALSRLGYTGCNEQIASFPVQAADWDLPAGFRPVTLDPAGSIAVLVVWGSECQRAYAEGIEVERERMIFAVLAVAPPQELRVAAIESYVIPVAVMVSDERISHRLAAWGFPALHDPGLSIVTALATPVLRYGTASGAAGAVAISLESSAAGPVTSGSAGAMRLFGFEGGVLDGVVDFTWTDYDAMTPSQPVLRSSGLGGVAQIASGAGEHDWREDYTYDFQLRAPGERGEPAKGGGSGLKADPVSYARALGRGG